MSMSFFKQTSAGVVLSLQVQPRSSRNQIVGLHGDLLKVKLTSPPVDGAANKCCCDFLAKLFGVAKSNVSIIGGETSRKKRVLVCGVQRDAVLALLNNRK